MKNAYTKSLTRFAKLSINVSNSMQKHGFKFVGCWDEVIGDMQNFVYILSWDDMNSRQSAWTTFNADEEWTGIKKESAEQHGQLVAKTSNRILAPAKYSPLT